MKLSKVFGLLILLGLISYFALQRMREIRWRSPYNSGMRALEEGRFPEAVRDLKAAVEAAESLGDHDHPLAICLSGLATAYGKQAMDAEAEPRLVRALAIRERVLGRDHPEVARSVNDLAWLCCDEGRYAEAERLSRRALAIREKALGHQNIEIGQNLSDLAWFLFKEGQYDQAERFLGDAMIILDHQEEASRLDLAACLNRLAILDQSLGRHALAMPRFERVLEIRAEHTKFLTAEPPSHQKTGRDCQVEKQNTKSVTAKPQVCHREAPSKALGWHAVFCCISHLPQ
jgi:tetratricopeptide (TPR) repeat protein